MNSNRENRSNKNRSSTQTKKPLTPKEADSSTSEQQERDILIQMDHPLKSDILVTDQVNPDQQVDTADVSTTTDQTTSQNHSSTTNTSDLDDHTSLQATLTKLTTANGSEVFLIGTAHFSQKSVQDVQKVMQTVKPSAVVLELCRERAFMLTLDEESLLEQNRKLSFDKIRSAIAEKGVAQGLIFIMFIKMSANLTEKLGLAPGSEFRAGSAEAQKLPGCSVVLGDRSLKVTVARLVASVSLWQKIKLVYQVLLNDASITQEDVEKCKDKDILEQLLEELAGQFPGFKTVLLDERNIYLAHSIYQWAQNSETSLGPQRVVAIVGIGHVAGIIENWGKTTDEDIKRLNEIPKASRTKRIVSKTIKYCSWAFLIYIGYRIIIPTSVQTAIHDKIVGH